MRYAASRPVSAAVFFSCPLRAVFLSLSVVLVLCVMLLLAVNTGGASPPPGEGDWIIEDQNLVRDENVTVNGNVIIEDGGELVLINGTVIINSGYPGEHSVVVKNGGALRMDDSDGDGSTPWDASLMAPSSAHARYTFEAFSGSRIYIENSVVEGCGYIWDGDSGNHSGPWIAAADVVIRNSLFRDNFAGLVLAGRTAAAGHESLLENIRIEGHGRYGIVLYETLEVGIDGCTITDCLAGDEGAGIWMKSSHGARISDVFISSGNGIRLENSGNNFFSGVEVHGQMNDGRPEGYGLHLHSSPLNSIENFRLEGKDVGLLFHNSSSNYMSGGTIEGCNHGTVFWWKSDDNVFSGATFRRSLICDISSHTSTGTELISVKLQESPVLQFNLSRSSLDALDTSFSPGKMYIEDSTFSERYSLVVILEETRGEPVAGADVLISETAPGLGTRTLYSTGHYGGNDRPTDSEGRSKGVAATACVYYGVSEEHPEIDIQVRHGGWEDSRSLEMPGQPHEERFEVLYPDFEIPAGYIAFSPEFPEEKEAVKVFARIYNNGVRTATTLVGLWDLSGETEVLLGTMELLVESGNHVKFFMETSLPAGDHKLKFVADPDDLTIELNEYNNIAFSEMIVSPMRPDLSISAKDFRASGGARRIGEPITLSVVVENDRMARITNGVVEFYAENLDSGNRGENPEFIGTAPLDLLQGEPYGTVSLVWTPRSAGSFRLEAVVREVKPRELRTDNNMAFINIYIISPPDLMVSPGDITISPPGGMDWPVTSLESRVDLALRNTGGTGADARATLYAIERGEKRSVMEWLTFIPAGGQRYVVAAWTPRFPGTATLELVLESSLLEEDNLQNNRAELDTQVAELPYLRFSRQLNMPSEQIAPGSSHTVSFVVVNDGCSAARVWIKLFLFHSPSGMLPPELDGATAERPPAEVRKELHDMQIMEFPAGAIREVELEFAPSTSGRHILGVQIYRSLPDMAEVAPEDIWTFREIAVPRLPDAAISPGDIEITGDPVENQWVEVRVTYYNHGDLPAEGMVSICLDKGTESIILTRYEVFIPGQGHDTGIFSFRAPARGEHELVASFENTGLPDSDTGNNRAKTSLKVSGQGEGPGMVAYAPHITVGITILGAVLYGATEPGKYRFALLAIPLYMKLKKEDMLDQFTRGRIYEVVETFPGEHYNFIKKKLGLQNGTLTYHLEMLEKCGYIKSVKKGMYRCFYPRKMTIPEDCGSTRKLTEVRKYILRVIEDSPGISQKDIAGNLNLTSATINYHLGILIEEGFVESKRMGMKKAYKISATYEGERVWAVESGVWEDSG